MDARRLRFAGRAADIGQTALFAGRLAGVADGPAVQDEAVAKVAALLGRDDLPQQHLHLLGLFDVVHQADAVAQPDAVGIGDDGRLAEHVPHDEVGALAADAGQGQQFFKGGGHLAVVFVPQYAHTGRDVPRLGVAQAAGLDDGLDVLRLGGGQGGHPRILGKELLHHHVDPRVGALGRQPDADQQLPGVGVVQGAGGVGIFCLQPLDHLEGQLLFGRKLCGRHLLSGHDSSSLSVPASDDTTFYPVCKPCPFP